MLGEGFIKAGIRKYAGWLLAILGTVFFVFGLSVYLNGPSRNGTSVVERRESETFSIEPNRYADYEYRSGFFKSQNLFLNVYANGSVSDTSLYKIEIFILNETSYLHFKNDTLFLQRNNEIKASSKSFEFNPVLDSIYYVVLFNSDSNATANTSLTLDTAYIIQTFDYGLAFFGLETAITGVVMFGLSFPLENPFDRILRRSLSASIFPPVRYGKDKVFGVEDYLGEKETRFTIIMWVILGVTILITFVLIVFYIVGTYPENIPTVFTLVAKDAIVRTVLFFFSCICLFFVPFVLISGYFSNLLQNFLLWKFGIKRHNPDEVKRAMVKIAKGNEILLRKASAPLSILFYALIVFFAYGIYMATDNPIVTLLAAGIPLVLVGAYTCCVSYRESYADVKARNLLRFENSVNTFTLMVTIPLFVLVWFLVWDSLKRGLYDLTVGSSVLSQGSQLVNEGIWAIASQGFTLFDNIKTAFVLLCVAVVPSLGAFLFFLQYFGTQKKRLPKKNFLVREVAIFIFTFLFFQVVLFFSQTDLLRVTLVSSIVSLVVSVFRIFLNSSLQNIPKKPVFCPNPECGRDLTDYPEDLIYCPYCTKALVEKERQKP